VCTIVLRLDPASSTPIVMAANRDEFRDRPADEPTELAPGLFAGRDRRGGGTWLAVGANGLAAVTNIREAPRDAQARSRGELPLAALLGTLPERFDAWNAFNLLVVDRRGPRVFSHPGGGAPGRWTPLAPGLHVIVNEPYGTDDVARVRHAAAIVGAGAPDFAHLADHGPPPELGLCHHGERYGTVSSTVVALDAGLRVRRYEHRPGLPCLTTTRDLTVEAEQVTRRRAGYQRG